MFSDPGVLMGNQVFEEVNGSFLIVYIYIMIILFLFFPTDHVVT